MIQGSQAELFFHYKQNFGLTKASTNLWSHHSACKRKRHRPFI